MERYAIVPARGNSKRIPRKNLRLFHGKPILQWVLEMLVEVKALDRIIVSTDDPEISEFVRELGFEAPFRRPKHLSDDFAPTASVVTHAIEWLLSDGASEQASFLTVYPTAVLMTPEKVELAEKLLEPDLCNFVFAGAKFPSPVERAWRRSASGLMDAVRPDLQVIRTQDFDTNLFYDLGQIYWSTASSWSPTIDSPQKRRMLELNSLEAVDIDTESDWNTAEMLFRLRRL